MVSLDEFIQTIVDDNYLICPIKVEFIIAYNEISFFEDQMNSFDKFIIETAINEDFVIISFEVKLKKNILILQEA